MSSRDRGEDEDAAGSTRKEKGYGACLFSVLSNYAVRLTSLQIVQPGTKAQLKPTFSKVKAKKETADDDGSLTETESRIRQWIAHGEMAGDAPSSALPAVQEETSTPHERSSTGGSLMGPPLTSNVTPTGSGSSGREKNPYYPPPADLEKVQLVVKWGGEVKFLSLKTARFTYLMSHKPVHARC